MKLSQNLADIFNIARLITLK